MSWFQTNPRKADIRFSNYIRKKAGWKCEMCGKICKIGDTWVGKLDAAHYMSRRHEATRFDPRNVHALCAGDHRRVGGYTPSLTGEYDLWMIRQYGLTEVKKIILQAHGSQRKDDTLTELYIKELEKDL